MSVSNSHSELSKEDWIAISSAIDLKKPINFEPFQFPRGSDNSDDNIQMPAVTKTPFTYPRDETTNGDDNFQTSFTYPRNQTNDYDKSQESNGSNLLNKLYELDRKSQETNSGLEAIKTATAKLKQTLKNNLRK